MRVEPRTRTRCAQCRGLKKLTSPKGCQFRNHAEMLKRDPFCARKCAEEFHGVRTFSGEMDRNRANDFSEQIFEGEVA